MFDGPLEDPATGSAVAALAGLLAKERGQGVWAFNFVQGVEMGRRNEVEVIVVSNEVEKVELGQRGRDYGGNIIAVIMMYIMRANIELFFALDSPSSFKGYKKWPLHHRKRGLPLTLRYH